MEALYLTSTSAKYMNTIAHEMYNRKQKTFIEENPQNEVLQPCIKTEKSFTTLFYWLQQLQITLQIQSRSVYNKLDLYQIHTLDRLFFNSP